MREILFRGKATNRIDGYEYRTKYKNGDWVHGLVTDVENYAGFSEMTNTSGISGIEVDKNTIGQFTGLTDKNGKKIFEGDIIKAVLKPGFIDTYAVGTVVFQNGTYKLYVTESENAKEHKKYTDKNATAYPIENNFINRSYQLEIIGNIHDNPELLKGGADND